MSDKTDSRIETLDRYLERLRNDDYETAASQFSEDAVYFHSPMHQEEVKIEGRDNIQSYFEKRGHKDIHHEIIRSAVDGSKATIVGHVTGEDVQGEEDYFVSFAKFDGDLISYYNAGLLKSYSPS